MMTIAFADASTAHVVRVDQPDELPDALRELNVSQRPVIVLVGGAGGMDESDLARVRPLFDAALAPVAERLGAAVVDGGTDDGVMRLMGCARAGGNCCFPLIGVAVESLVTWPGGPHGEGWVPLEPRHSHFVLVPGSRWSDEAPWISRVATLLSGPHRSVTVLINGGEIAWNDALHSIRDNRPVIVVAGSGRTSDHLASAARGAPRHVAAHAKDIVDSGLLMVVDLADGPAGLSSAVERILSTSR